MVRKIAALLLLSACSWSTPKIVCSSDDQCPSDLGCDVQQGFCAQNPPPAGFTAAVTTDLGNPYAVVLTWPLRPDSSQYTVYRGASADALTALQEQPGNSTGFTDTTAAHGKNYLYALARMRNNSNGAESAKTAPITVAVPPDPPADASLHLTAGATTAHLVWDAAPGSTDYEVVRYGDTGKTVLHLAATALDDTIVPEQVYSYTVAGRNQGNAGKASRSAVVWSELTPTIAGSDGGELIKWSVTYPGQYTGFDIYGSPDGTVWTVLQSNIFNQYNDATPRPAGYFYKVVAKMSGQDLNATRETAPIRIPAAPQVTVAGGAGTARVSWPAVAGADKYLVTGGSFASAQAVTALFVDDPAPNGADYAVQAQLAGNSGKPGHVSLPPTPLLTNASGDSTITITWRPVAAATGYLLSISENGGAPVVQPAATNSYTQTGANLASSYTYTLQSTVGTNSSLASGVLEIVPQPALSLAGGRDPTYGNAVVNLTATGATGTLGYYYSRSDDGGATYTSVGSAGSQFAVPAGAAGALYRAEGYPAGSNSRRSSVPVSLPAAPATVIATAGAGKNTVSWSAVTGADHYLVSVSSVGNLFSHPAGITVDGATLSYDDVGAPGARSTFYLVQAVKGAGTSLYPAEASAPAAGFAFAYSAPNMVGYSAWTVAAGDVNNDGRADGIGVQASYFATALTSPGGGAFAGLSYTNGPTNYFGYSAVVDLNGDGRGDVIASVPGDANVLVYLSNADGTWQATSHAAGAGANGLVVKHLSGGSGTLPDLLVACPNAHELHYYQGIALSGADNWSGPGSAKSTGTNSAPTLLAVGDFNNDGKMDAAASDIPYQKIELVSDVTSSTPAVSTPITPADQTLYGIAADDMNKDGKLDLILTFTSGKVVVYKGNGDLTFNTASPIVTTLAGTPHDVITADLDGDTYPDAVVSLTGGLVMVLYGDHLGGFSRTATFNAPGALNAAFGHFSSATRPDIFAGGTVFFNTTP